MKVAYERNKIILFGVGGVAIAVILILVFIPAQVYVGVNPTVALQEVSGYGFQIVKISEAQTNVIHLNITLDSFEIRNTDGDWFEVEIYGGSASFNLLRDLENSIVAEVGDLDVGSYNAVRFRVVQGLQYTNATLGTGEVLTVDVPNFKVELMTSIFEIFDGMGSLSLELHTGSGVLTNYMLPNIHISIGTVNIKVLVYD